MTNSPSNPAPEGGALLIPGGALPFPPTLLIDSREPFNHAYNWQGYPSQRVKLDFGDYSVLGCSELISVERKTLADLAQSITKRRFWKELERAKDIGCRSFSVVIEGKPDDLNGDRLRSMVAPAAILGAMRKVREHYGFDVQWAGDRASAAHYTLNFLLWGYIALKASNG